MRVRRQRRRGGHLLLCGDVVGLHGRSMGRRKGRSLERLFFPVRLGANEGKGFASACRLFCLKATPMPKESYPQGIELS